MAKLRISYIRPRHCEKSFRQSGPAQAGEVARKVCFVRPISFKIMDPAAITFGGINQSAVGLIQVRHGGKRGPQIL